MSTKEQMMKSTNKELDNSTVEEINRLVIKGHINWDQNDYNTIYLFLGMLAGKILKENDSLTEKLKSIL